MFDVAYRRWLEFLFLEDWFWRGQSVFAWLKVWFCSSCTSFIRKYIGPYGSGRGHEGYWLLTRVFSTLPRVECNKQCFTIWNEWRFAYRKWSFHFVYIAHLHRTSFGYKFVNFFRKIYFDDASKETCSLWLKKNNIIWSWKVSNLTGGSVRQLSHVWKPSLKS